MWICYGVYRATVRIIESLHVIEIRARTLIQQQNESVVLLSAILFNVYAMHIIVFPDPSSAGAGVTNAKKLLPKSF